MKDDIRKKFLDILFEPEEEEEVIQAPLKAVKPTENKEKEVKEEPKKKEETDHPKTLNAKEFLYNKARQEENSSKPKPSSFIFMDTGKHSPKKVEEESGNSYTLTTNLSPMFGKLDGGDEKKEEADLSQSSRKNFNSYLGTVISPIYGIDVHNDYGNSMNLSIQKVEKVYEPYIEEEEPEPEEEPVNYDSMTDTDNLFIDEIIEEEFARSEEAQENNPLNDIFSKEEEEEEIPEPSIGTKPEEEKIDNSIYRQVLNEERGFSNTSEIDLFEDLFKEDED